MVCKVSVPRALAPPTAPQKLFFEPAPPPGAAFIFSLRVCLVWEKSARFAAESQPLQRLSELSDALADVSVVVSSDRNKGGTWAGATEQVDQPLDLYRSRYDQRQSAPQA